MSASLAGLWDASRIEPHHRETEIVTVEQSAEVIDSARVRRMVFATKDFSHGLWFKGRSGVDPTGTFSAPSSMARQAGNAGNWTAWRLFIQPRGRRTARFQVDPLLIAADAAKAVRIETVTNGRFSPRSRLHHPTAPHPHDGVHIPGADNVLAHDWQVIGPKGVGTHRYGLFSVGRVVVNVNLVSPYADRWPWDEVIDLCGRQADKVNRALGAK